MAEQLEHGTVESVAEVAMGDELVAAAPAGSTSLLLGDAVDFAEDGGTLSIAGDVLAYTSADLDTDTLHLASPTTVAYEESEPVLVHPQAVARVASVRLDLDGEAVEVRVPHALYDRVAEGVRADDPEQVSLSLDGSEWVLADVLGREPVIDGTFLDPTTVPEPVPAEAPATAPALTVTGVSNGLVVRADAVDVGTLIEYHITDTPPLDTNGDELPFTPTAATLLGDATRGTLLVVTHLPDGTPLVPETTYHLRTVAFNAAGPAPEPGPVATGELDLDTVSNLVTTQMEAGFLLAGSIQVGQITIDPDTGITIPTVGGGIELPADGGEATFSGSINTGSITVEDHLTINGVANAINGTLLLANVVEAPTAAPQVGWQFPYTTTIGADTWSLTDSLDGTEWVTITWGTDRVHKYRKSDGVRTANVDVGDYYVKGIVKGNPSFYFAVAENRFDDLDLYLLKLDANLNVTKSARVVGKPNVPKAAGIGVDYETGHILVAYSRTNGEDVVVRSFATLDLAQVGTATYLEYGVEVLTGSPVDMTGIHRLPTGDGGAYEWWVGLNGSLVRHAAATPPADPWVTRPESVKGFTWDGTRLWSLGYSSYKTWKWSTNKWPAAVAVSHTWYDSDPAGTGTHETMAGPAVNYQPPPFAYLRVVRPASADAGDVDSPDTARIYIDNHLQEGGEPWAQYTIYETVDLGGAPAPTVNGFDNAAANPGRIASAAQDGAGPLIELWGDGTARLPGLPPTGSIIMWAGGTEPAGWLFCKGQALSTAVYPDLFAVVGYSFGGSGSTFYAPDLRSRFPFGADPGTVKGDVGDHETGESGTAPGAGDSTRLDHRHSHTIPAVSSTDGHSKAAGTTTPNVLALRAFDGHNHGGATGNAGVAGGNTQYHALLTLNFIIKL